MSEEWRDIEGFEGAYQVSSSGLVRSLTRRVRAGGGRVRISPGRVLSVYTGDHYSKVRLKVDGVGATKNVHQLVAEAFLGPRPLGFEVCHNNGNPHDNRVENLRYATHSENQYDITAHGRSHLANRTHCNHGHEFTPENTIVRTGRGESGRRCRACESARSRRRSAA